MKIERLQVRNFKALQNIDMNKIPNFCVIVGANGAGKSTLFNVFKFLSDALESNVHAALAKQGGSKGFSEVKSRSKTSEKFIEIEIRFRSEEITTETGKSPLITYILKIGEQNSKAYVEQEILKYRRGQRGKPFEFLNFKNGKGTAVTNESINNITDESQLERDTQKLKANNILAIKALAQFEKFPAVVELGKLIENWHLSDIHINKARNEQEAGLAEHLSREGENLSLVIDYLFNEHHQIYEKIIEQLKKNIPGIVNVEAKTIETGQVLLKLTDKSFQDPFLVRFVSDGTIKMLAYLVLLYDPNPHPLLCVEEPENQLYPKLLERLAEEFRDYAQRGGQVFVSTHSPDFLNAVELNEVFLLIKKNGYTTIKPAKEDKQLASYMSNGDKMGWLWKEGFFTGVDPT